MNRNGIVVRIFLIHVFLTGFTLSVFSQLAGSAVHGEVFDKEGATIPNARVILRLADRSGSPVETRTDTDGKFTFTNVGPGKYLVTVGHRISAIEAEVSVLVSGKQKVELKIELGRACGSSTGNVPAGDIAIVVRHALTEAAAKLLTDKERKEGFILSSKNITPSRMTSSKSLNFRVMNQKAIQEKADREGDFPYILVSEVRGAGKCVAISVDYLWAVAKDSKVIHMNGGGFTFEYRKKGKKWVGTQVSQWVS